MFFDSELPGPLETKPDRINPEVSAALGAVVMSGDFEAPWGEGPNPEGELYARALGVGSVSVAIAGTKIELVLTDETRRQAEEAIDSSPPSYV